MNFSIRRLRHWFSFDTKPIGPRNLFTPMLAILGICSLIIVAFLGLLEFFPMLKLKVLYLAEFAIPMFTISGILSGSILGLVSVSDLSRVERLLFVFSTLVFLNVISQLAQFSILPMNSILFGVTLFSLLISSILGLQKLRQYQQSQKSSVVS